MGKIYTFFFFILLRAFVGMPEKILQKKPQDEEDTKYRKKPNSKWLDLIIYKEMTKGAVLGSVRQQGIAANPANNVLYTEQGRDASSKGTLK